MTCSACAFARYCSKDCQKFAWKAHKPECDRLKAVFPNLPLTEVLFLSRVIDKLLFIEENGDKFGWEKERKFDELVAHTEDIRKDTERYAHFEKLFTKMSAYRKDEMIEKERFFEIYCRVTINSHGVQDVKNGDDVGLSLDLGVSKYDHSCRPNCSMIFDGTRVYVRPLSPDANPWEYNNSFISYTDVGRSRYRRQEDLKSKWYFDCQCERCVDPADDLLTCIKCQNPKCGDKLVTHETAERIPEMQSSIFETYRMCFPNMDQKNGFQLLDICRMLIQNGSRRADAMPYAFDAMTIFEVCYGMSHPYYLQTLALWTFLEKEPQKTDEELLALLEFKSDKPVDISRLLS
ncbi:Protein SET-18 a [Aphelenchoides avenae]|nr:Protein SET-18 a [Aphelenchus avenae]